MVRWYQGGILPLTFELQAVVSEEAHKWALSWFCEVVCIVESSWCKVSSLGILRAIVDIGMLSSAKNVCF